MNVLSLLLLDTYGILGCCVGGCFLAEGVVSDRGGGKIGVLGGGCGRRGLCCSTI